MSISQRNINFREIEAYDDLGNRVRAVDAEYSTGQSDLLPAGETIKKHYEAGNSAKGCIDGDLDPYLPKPGASAWGMPTLQGVFPQEYIDMANGQYKGSLNGQSKSDCFSERYDPDPGLLIDYGKEVSESQ